MPSTTRAAADSPAGVPLPDRIRDFLAAARLATISTLDVDGSPHQAVVWYALDGDSLLINSRVERHWPRNLERDPRLSVAVYEDVRRFHWIGLKGSAEPIHRGDDATADIEAIAQRYGRDPSKYAGQARVTFRFTPERAYEYRPGE